MNLHAIRGFTCCCIFLLMGLPFVHAQGRFFVPNDESYYVVETPEARFIYPAEYRPLLPNLKAYNEVFKNIYEKEFAWELDEKPTFILASSRNQIANGFATILPRLHTVFYGASAEIIDEMTSASWLNTLLIHETAHLYQLNTKQGYSVILKSVLGNSNIDGLSFLPPFTYTMNPNIFLPTFILEGNATYNEGRFGNGGRLYNGMIRSLFLQMVSEGLITPDRLMNDHLNFPYTREKYWIGGYFFLDVAEKQNREHANYYFMAHAHHNANPLQVDAPFKKVFTRSYTEIIHSLNQGWSTLAQKVTRANDPILFVSDQHAPLTKNKNEIRFLTTTNKNLPVAHIFEFKNKGWSNHKMNSPFGRLLRTANDQLAVVSSEATDNQNIRYGLYQDGYNFENEHLDKIYYDIQGEHKLWADAKKSFLTPMLYLNNESLGATASSALLHNQNAYYFKQQHKTRTLYANRTPVFSYNGYYGYPVDVRDDGAILFIGPVETGSTLFIWNKNQFMRAHSSDAIVDAKLIDNETALIVEITTKGYEYKITKLNPTSGTPSEYIYFYEKDPLFKTFTSTPTLSTSADTKSDLSADTKSDPVVKDTSSIASERKYSSVGDLQFDGIDPMIFFGVDTPLIAQATIRYSDPLQNHNLGLILGSGSFGEMSTGFLYQNAQHVVNWDIFGLYQKRAKVEENLNASEGDDDRWRILDRYDAWLAAAGFDYLFFRRPQLASNLSSHFIYEYEHPHIPLDDIDQKYTLLSSLSFGHMVSHPLAYSSYRALQMSFDHEFIHSAPDWDHRRNLFGTEVLGQYDLFRETYLKAKYQKVFTDGQLATVPIEFGPSDLPYPTSTHIERNTSYPDANFFSASKVQLELKQAIHWGYYFTRFPFSLRRSALVAQYNEYYGALKPKSAEETLFHETGGGAEFEILFFHRFPIRMRLMYYDSNYQNESTTLFTVGTSG